MALKPLISHHHARIKRQCQMTRIPDPPFLPPISLSELLAQLDDWPSPDPWPFIALDTERVSMTTPITLLSFDRCQEFDDEEYEAFERWALSQGLCSFLNNDLLADVRDSLAHEIEQLEDEADIAIVERNYDAILIRAINHYNEMDAFVSLKDWVGSEDRVIKGILPDYL
jgi:hypothetical protein